MTLKTKTDLHTKSIIGILVRIIGIGIILTPLLLLATVSFGKFSPIDDNLFGLPLDIVSVQTKFIFILIIELRLIILVTGLFAVAKVFDLLANQQWFLPDFSKLLKTFGISLIVFVLSSPVAYILKLITTVMEVFYNIKEYKDVLETTNIHAPYSISLDGMLIILVGILLILVAKVLSKASKNAQDLEQIV